MSATSQQVRLVRDLNALFTQHLPPHLQMECRSFYNTNNYKGAFSHLVKYVTQTAWEVRDIISGNLRRGIKMLHDEAFPQYIWVLECLMSIVQMHDRRVLSDREKMELLFASLCQHPHFSSIVHLHAVLPQPTYAMMRQSCAQADRTRVMQREAFGDTKTRSKGNNQWKGTHGNPPTEKDWDSTHTPPPTATQSMHQMQGAPQEKSTDKVGGPRDGSGQSATGNHTHRGCLHCKGNHRVIDCPTATSDDKIEALKILHASRKSDTRRNMTASEVQNRHKETVTSLMSHHIYATNSNRTRTAYSYPRADSDSDSSDGVFQPKVVHGPS
jgi:hypothetical protein